MKQSSKLSPERIRNRRINQDHNVFSRLPAIYAASRSQGLQFLKVSGDLSIVEWRTLWDLAEGGPMTIRDLSLIQRTDPSLLSRALPGMREKGLITMERDASDKRQTVVELTNEGVRAYQSAAPIMAQRRAALRQSMTEDEIQTLLALLGRLEAFLNTPADQILETEATP